MNDEEGLDDDLAALVRQGSRIPAMSPERLTLARERLATSVLGPGGGGDGNGGDGDGEKGTPGGDVPAPPPAPTGLYTLSAAKLGGIVGVAFALGIGVGIGGRTAFPASPAGAAPSAVRAYASDAPSTLPPSTVASAEVDAGLSLPVPAASEGRPTMRPAASSPAPAAASVTRESAAAERALLDQARRALREGDGERALVLTSRHEADHPKGALKEEREVLRIGALVSLGRIEDARARLSAFRHQYPASPFLPALESQVPSE